MAEILSDTGPRDTRDGPIRGPAGTPPRHDYGVTELHPAPAPPARPARRWPSWAPAPAALAAAVPVVLVNAVAVLGQLAFLRAHLPWPLAGQILMAVTVESVAVYLAAHAAAAELANDSAFRLRLAAYGWALAIGAANYSHYAAPGWRPTFTAVAVGLCSVASPWLWGVHTRRVSRDRLLAGGLIQPHALRLGPTRWAWHPVRSARVMWLATWRGTTDPAAAIAEADAATLPALELTGDVLAAMPGQARLAAAFGAIGRADVPAALALLSDRGAPLDDSHAYALRRAMLDGRAGGDPR